MSHEKISLQSNMAEKEKERIRLMNKINESYRQAEINEGLAMKEERLTKEN